jgi:rRNA-processing protein FCF1
MKKKEAKEWIKAFKKAKFKCIVPNQVIEAMSALKGKKGVNK